MYGVVIFELVVVAAVIVLVNGDTVYYATKYDHLDIERILNNRRMVIYYSQCLLNKGPCPPQGVAFKKILPEALETNCLRCTEKQKVVTYRTIKRLKKEYPKIWAELQVKWDPNDIYVKRFEETYKNPLPTTTNENEIILDDRFGDISITTKKPTTKTITKKPQKGKYPTLVPSKMTTQKTTPSFNNVGSTSQNRPISLTPYNPSYGGNVSTNQVGDTGSTPSYNLVNTTLSTFTANNTKTEVTSQTSVASVNTQRSDMTSFSSIMNITNISTGVSLHIPSVTTSVPPSIVTQISSSSKAETANQTVSHESPLLLNLFTSNPISFSPSSDVSDKQEFSIISPNPKPLLNSTKAGITFDIPPSSINNSLTLTIIQNSPITANIKPITSNSPEVPPTINTLKSSTNSFPTNVNSVNRQPDVISQVLSSFLANNRLPSINIRGSVDKTISNEQVGQVNRPGLQLRLPSISVNTQAEVFHPLGSFVKDITTVGGKLIETGTSIADTLLSSVRILFTPPQRTSPVRSRL